MRGGPDTGRPHIDPARICLGIGDELGNGSSRERGIYHHNQRQADNARDRRDVAEENKIELVVERRVDWTRHVGLEKRMAVRGCAHDHFGADIAAATRAVFYDELLAKSLREPWSHEPWED